MKLIYITATMPFGNGEEFFIQEISEWMRLGHEILIIPRSSSGKAINQDALPLQKAGIDGKLLSTEILTGFFKQAMLSPLKLFNILCSLVDIKNPKATILNLLVLPKSIWAADLAQRRDIDHIHCCWASTTATMGMIIGRLTGIPWSFTAHRGDLTRRNLLPEKMNKAEFARYISIKSLEMARNINPGLDDANSHIIHLGVKMEEARPDNREDDIPTILCPARLIAIKGHKYLLHALKELIDKQIYCKLLIAGDGELMEPLTNLCQELRLSAWVEFLGQVPHDQILDWYRSKKIDLVVLPSLYLGNFEHEGIPVSLMEPMSYGIPVVSTTTGGIPELVVQGTGFLVPPADSAALAEAMEGLINDKALRRNFGENARQKILEDFNVNKIVQQLAVLMSGSPVRD